MKKKIRFAAALLLALVFTALMSMAAFADFTYEYKVGDVIAKTTVMTSGSKILSCTPSAGILPSGVVLNNDDTTLYISGTPSSAGTYESAYWVKTEAGNESFRLTLVIKAVTTPTPTPVPTAAPTATPAAVPTATPAATALPKITKHPTGETVEVGGSAMFIARADNATEIVWRIVSADTTNTVPASDAGSYFTGITVSGLGTEKLTLSTAVNSP